MHIFVGNNEKATAQQHKFYGSMWLDDPLMVDLLFPLGTESRGQGAVLRYMTRVPWRGFLSLLSGLAERRLQKLLVSAQAL